MEDRLPKPEARYAIIHSLGKTSEPAQGIDHISSAFLLKNFSTREKVSIGLTMDGKPLTFDRAVRSRHLTG